MELQKTKFFYGWYVVFAAFIANIVSFGSGFYIFNIFMEPLCNLNNWSRTDVSLAIVFGMSAGILSSYPIGTIAEKTGLRVLVLLGPTLAGLSFFSLFKINILIYFYLITILLFISNEMYGGIVSNSLVNNWFVKKRGKALGISTSGLSLSGVIFPFIAFALLERGDLKEASYYIGLSIMLLGPILFLIVRNSPEICGLFPDGDTRFEPNENDNNEVSNVNQSKEKVNYKYLIKSIAFWKVIFIYVFILIGVIGVMSHFKPRFVELGYDDKSSMQLLTLAALFGTFGKFFWAVLCDKYDSIKVLGALIFFMTVGLVFSLNKDSVFAQICFVLLFGFSMGGVMSTFPIIVAEMYGRRHFIKATKCITPFFIFNLLGLLISAQSYDRYKTYESAYLIYIVLNMMTIPLVVTLMRKRSFRFAIISRDRDRTTF